MKLMRLFILLLGALMCAAPAFAQVAISALPPAALPLSGSEIVPLVQSGVTSNVSVNNLRGTGNALFGTTSGNTTNDFVSMSNTTVGVKDSGYSLSGTGTHIIGTSTASPAQGDVAYYNGTSWVDLGVGTSGQYLETLGASANPQWNSPSGSGNALFGTTSGNVSGNVVSMSNTTTGVQDSGVAVANLANVSTAHQSSGSVTVSAAQFLHSDGFIATAAVTLIYPATSTLSAANGSNYLNAQGGAITITPNTGDQVCVDGACGSASATYVLAQGNSGWVTTNGTGQLQVGLSLGSASGGSGTVNSGTSGQLTYYAGTGTTVSGTNAGTGVITALGNNLSAAGGVASTIASGTSALGTGAISSGACATVVTTSAPNVATTDVINAGFNGDPTAVTGYAPTTNGMLTIISYPSSGNVNFKVCNNTSGSVTPGAITLNWRVLR